MGCRAWKLEVDLLDDAELLVGDHESQHHDHADQDEEGEQHAGQVADDPNTLSTQYHHSTITAPSLGFHNHAHLREAFIKKNHFLIDIRQ